MNERKLRNKWFGYHTKDVDQYLRTLEDEVNYTEQWYEFQLNTEKDKLAMLLEEEDALWAELQKLQGNKVTGHSQKERSEPLPVAPPLGELLIQRGLITEEQLSKALEYQKENGGRLGDILIDLNLVRPDDLVHIFEERNQKMRLGEMLLRNGLITEEQLQEALAYQKKSGGQLGEILMSLHMIDPAELYRVIATQNQIGRIGSNFLNSEVPKLPAEISRTYNAIVVGERRSRYLVAVGDLLKDSDVKYLENLLNKPIEQVLATPEEMQSYWDEFYSEEQMHISTKALIEDQPANSAHITFTTGQMVTFSTMFVFLITFLLISWKITLIVVNCLIQLFYFVMTCFKCYILMRGTDRNTQMRFTEEEILAMDESKLPVYTILVPMYKEANIIPKLIKNLEEIDYPRFKLDIRLLIEEDDTEAMELIQSMQLPPYYTMLVVPHSLPKTKPKACNYGLIRARGEYVVIYDAEDRPDKYQLKKAVAAFRALPDEYVCVQAKLNYFNSEQNLLTRWFTQEYSMWFELLLPGVMKLDVPIPLGGTSNHFKMDVLKKLQAWDPYNVTEDADLGIRLYKHGYKTAIIDSNTWEEANSQVRNWIRQRSRWIKGYMQTWLVHMRHPFRLWKELGTKGFWGFQVMVLATPALPIINPLFWFLLILWYATESSFIPMFFPGPIYYISALMFFVGNFIFIYSHAVGMHWVIQEMNSKGMARFSYRLVKFALLTPIYWFLMSLAAMKALWQLITKPFYWEKTDHGLPGSTTAKRPVHLKL